jgi:hypothetical protein
MTRIVASALAVSACLAALLAVVLPREDETNSARPGAIAAAAVGSGVVFEANGGRTDSRVDFLTRGRNFALFLTRDGAVLRARHSGREAIVRTSLVGASTPVGHGEQLRRGRVNVLRGSDPANWRTGIPAYGRVRYPSVYRGIDLVYHGKKGALEYDFQLAPGADPREIAISVGGGSMWVDDDGSLAIRTPAGIVRQQAPVAYQAGGRKVDARWRLKGSTARFELGSYDRSQPLVIDPVLGYGTFAGGSASDYAYDIKVDDAGSAYVTGTTLSDDFPSVGAIQSHQDSQNEHNDVFVTKIAAGGGSFVYSTYIGGTNNDTGSGLALASDGGAVVVGNTSSASDFPTSHPLTGTAKGTGGAPDAFILRLTPNGDGLVYSTLFGGTGTENAADVVLDASDNVYVVGVGNGGTGFPVGQTAGYQATPSTGPDAFLAKLTWDGSALTNAYSTLYGGSGTYPNGGDSATGVVLGINGHVYVTGTTYSTAFPTTAGVITPTDPDSGTYPSGADGFLVDFDLTQSGASSRTAATYLGGAGADSIAGIDRDKISGGLLVVGQTSSNTLPNGDTTQGFTRTAGTGTIDGWIGWVGSDLTSANNYWVGGNATDSATGVQVIQDGSAITMLAYVAGNTASSNFSVTDSPVAASTTPSAFVVKFNSGARPLSAILGPVGQFGSANAIAVDGLGSAYVAGTAYDAFPTTAGSAQPVAAGPVNNPGANQTIGPDAFVARLDLKKPVLVQKPAVIITTGSATFQLSGRDTTASYQCSAKTAGGTLTAPASCGSLTFDNKVTYTDLAEGQQKFQARAKDDLGSFSQTTTYDFVVDLHPPAAFELDSPASGAQTAEHSPTFAWKSASDVTAVTYQLTIDGTVDTATPSCSASACSLKTSRVLGNGPHTWTVRATDAVSRSTDSTQRTFTVADPPSAKFSIAPNPVLVGRNVTFDGSASVDANHPISRYEWDLDGDGSFETDGGASPTTGRAYAGAQDVNIQLRVTGDTGLTSTAAQALHVTAGGVIPTQLGVTINNGAQYTRTPDVVVSVSAPPTITQMLFSNDGGFLAPTVFAPQKTVKWKLDSSGPERLPKTIYVRFLTGPFASETFQDDIILDEIPPKVEQASVVPAAAGSSRASAVAAAAKAKRWTLKLKASDSNSGVAGVQITANKKKPGKVLKYKRRVTIKTVGSKLWVRAVDRAGNISPWRAAKSASKRGR